MQQWIISTAILKPLRWHYTVLERTRKFAYLSLQLNSTKTHPNNRLKIQRTKSFLFAFRPLQLWKVAVRKPNPGIKHFDRKNLKWFTLLYDQIKQNCKRIWALGELKSIWQHLLLTGFSSSSESGLSGSAQTGGIKK